MTQVNCFMVDCRHRFREVCQKPAVEVDKSGRCVSFDRIPGYLMGHGYDARFKKSEGGTAP
ncbi:MAG: hypothetical protein ABSA11_05645 [Candidatus Bathyarchaeia archaeon]